MLSLTIVIIPLLIRKIIDNFILYEIENHLFLLVILLAILFILLNAVYPLLLNSIVNKTNSQLRRDIMEKLKNKKIEQLSKNGDKVMQVIINDVPVCQSLLTSFAFNIIIQLITFTCIVIILLNLHLKLGLIILLFVPFYISIFFIFGKKLEEINANYLSIRDRLSGNIQNIILNKNILKHSINKKSTYYKKYEKNLYGIYYWYRKQGRFDSVIKTLFNLLQVIIFLFVIFYGKDLIEEKEITIGSYIAFVMFTFNFFSPIHEIIDLSLEFKTAIVSVRRVYQIYTLKEESNLF
ncbi:ABC transporter transmembrane domain-containing protein, partial [Lysinibacillus sphaericus]|uniref:ABC transporter transmembrane domain-containing protein n=1 Tax=Lysinibacillus sphaericus TaxID=1421 RepID=UPI0015E1E5D3